MHDNEAGRLMRASTPTEAQDLDAISRSDTPAQIERAFQRACRRLHQRGVHYRHVAWGRLYRACNAQADAIAEACGCGDIWAYRLDKGTGCSQRWRIGGDVYSTGTWGNGAGYRWALSSFEDWYAARLRAGGIRGRRRIKSAVGWLLQGYRWRALKHIADARRRHRRTVAVPMERKQT